MADVVADLVATMLGLANLGGTRLRLVVGPKHRLELAGAAENVRRVLDEQVEEPLLARDQAETHVVPPMCAVWGGASVSQRMVASGSLGQAQRTASLTAVRCSRRWTGPSSPSSRALRS